MFPVFVLAFTILAVPVPGSTMTATALKPLLSPGDALPGLKGEFLTGRSAALPEAASGKVTLLALGFTYESRFEVEPWVARFREEFGANPQVTFFEVPMIGGIARAGKWFIDAGMRSGTPKPDQEHVITVYGGTEPWKQRVGFHSPKAAYIILLDRQGAVRWVQSDNFGTESFDALARQVNGLLEQAMTEKP